MPVSIALLRAINLGSRNKISMPDLRALFEALGAKDVATHVQSGNVVFRGQVGVADIEERITAELGHDIRVLLRTKAEMTKVVAACPFATGDDLANVHVTFLDGKSDADKVAAIDPSKFAPDEFAVVGREVHLRCPNGYGRSKLNNAFLEKKLGRVGTTRNWRTVTTLVELAGAL